MRPEQTKDIYSAERRRTQVLVILAVGMIIASIGFPLTGPSGIEQESPDCGPPPVCGVDNVVLDELHLHYYSEAESHPKIRPSFIETREGDTFLCTVSLYSKSWPIDFEFKYSERWICQENVGWLPSNTQATLESRGYCPSEFPSYDADMHLEQFERLKDCTHSGIVSIIYNQGKIAGLTAGYSAKHRVVFYDEEASEGFEKETTRSFHTRSASAVLSYPESGPSFEDRRHSTEAWRYQYPGVGSLYTPHRDENHLYLRAHSFEERQETKQGGTSVKDLSVIYDWERYGSESVLITNNGSSHERTCSDSSLDLRNHGNRFDHIRESRSGGGVQGSAGDLFFPELRWSYPSNPLDSTSAAALAKDLQRSEKIEDAHLVPWRGYRPSFAN